MKIPQILAPAGGIDNLISGVSAGADAVYMGWGELNARRNAKNFTKEEFLQAAAYCKARGVKVYMTLNTLIYDREITLVQQALELACNSQIDGIIVQDMGVAALAKKLCPALPLHGSTQMVVHNLSGALALSELGYSCAVLAREMSKDEISLVTRKGGIPTEVFVHGALCMSISGQCYMSSMIGERSGNRGLCAQACRLPFSANGNKDDYALSLKDSCLVPKLKELSSMGVSVLKIEGRMKRPEYVTAAVTACRNSLANKPVDYSVLQSVFSRSGFTSGYYDKRLGRDMFGIRGKDDVTASSDVVPQLGTNSQKEFPRVELHFNFTLQPNTPCLLSVTDDENNTVTVTGEIPQTAISKPTTQDMILASLSKLGGTFYILGTLNCNIADDLMLPVSKINVLRRDALEQLTEIRSKLTPIPFKDEEIILPPKTLNLKQPALRCICSKAAQVTEAIIAASELIYVPIDEIEQLDIVSLKDKLVVMLPHVCFGDDIGKLTKPLLALKEQGITRLSSCHIGGLHLGKSLGFILYGEYGLNITNTLAMQSYADFGVIDTMVSFELNMPRAKALGDCIPYGIIAYGLLPLMTTRNCPLDDNCSKCNGNRVLTDRKNMRFPVRCYNEYKEILNSAPLYLADKKADLVGFDFITLLFTNEPADKCDDILNEYLVGEGTREGITRGLYYRNVM